MYIPISASPLSFPFPMYMHTYYYKLHAIVELYSVLLLLLLYDMTTKRLKRKFAISITYGIIYGIIRKSKEIVNRLLCGVLISRILSGFPVYRRAPPKVNTFDSRCFLV